MKSCRIALVGDHNPEVTAHRAIPEAVRLAGQELGIATDAEWVHTSLLRDPAAQLSDFNGVWVVPASPYANTDGVLAAIEYAREEKVPLLGTCGGLQHLVIEYARNVLGMTQADHAETNATGETLVIAPLACSLVEKSETLKLADSGILRNAYGTPAIEESYRCSYGINPRFAEQLFRKDLKPTAWGGSGEVRAMELQGHPFFVGTLFQPERRALRGEAPPMAMAFLKAANQTMTKAKAQSSSAPAFARDVQDS